MNVKSKSVIFLSLIFFLCTASYLKGASDKYIPQTLRAEQNGADYLVVAPAAYLDALQPLLDKRAADGLRVAVATPEKIHGEFKDAAAGAPAIQAFIRYAHEKWQRPAPEYLLLVGDTVRDAPYSPKDNTVPTFYVATESNSSKNTASDNPYADVDGDELPDIATGRIPADSPDELKVVVRKILDYEQKPAPGQWRRRVSMFASEGHFGPAVDSMLEEMFKKLVSHNVSPNFELNMTYANPDIPYFYIAEEFNQKVIDRFNEGSLFMVYIGHGLQDSFDDVRWEKKRYPIMESKDVPKVNPGAMRQFVFIIACDTGMFTMKDDSIGELLLKSKTGPIGIFASSEVSHPYSNSILSKDIAYYFLTERPKTVGRGTLKVKRGLFERKDQDRKLIDSQARLMLGAKVLKVCNRDHLYLYNFFGDPATIIPYPADNLTVSAPEQAAPGENVPVTIKTPYKSDGKLHVTLECQPTDIIYETTDTKKLTGNELKEAIKKNYNAANNKVAVTMETAPTADGSGNVDMKIPEWIPAGLYYIKVYASNGVPDAMGYTQIRIIKATGDGR